jgi:hypothetical protein
MRFNGGRIFLTAPVSGAGLKIFVETENEGHDVARTAFRHSRQMFDVCARFDRAENVSGAASVQPSGQTKGSRVTRAPINTSRKVAIHRRTSSVYSSGRAILVRWTIQRP